MNEVNIEIKSRDIIKPHSPTPENLRNFKLSLLDQLSPQEYVPMIFYYAPNNHPEVIKPQNRLFQLKKSLSHTLTKFYPLAGKVRNNQSVECNDEGVEFIEARVNNYPLSGILEQPEVELLDRFLPHDYHCTRTAKELFQLAVQANVFSCGGIAIGMCILHKIVDGITFTSFVNTWAEHCRGGCGGDHSLTPMFVGPNLFPQRDLSGLLPTLDIPKDKCITKRFVFDNSRIAELKERVAAGRLGADDHPSRNEVVSAQIWKCAINVSKEKPGLSIRPSVLTQTVNLRPRMEPPLPDYTAGNLLWLAMAKAPARTANSIDVADLVNEIRQSITKFNKAYVRSMQGESGYSVIFESLMQVVELVSNNVEIYRFTNLGQFQLYEADFGWGKPIWISSAGLIFKNVVVLIGTRYGDGIEAWVTLEEQDMAIFETDPELLSYASTTRSASNLMLTSQL